MEIERRYLTNLKGLLIILVVVGHFGQTVANLLPESIGFIGHGLVLFVYLFHMPLFIFVSGYLSKNADKRRGKAFSDLFIPYIVFQLLCGVCLLVLTKSGEALQEPFEPQLGAWYLLSLFGYRLVLPEVRQIKGIVPIGIFLTIFTCVITGVASEFALRKSFGFFVYFMVGYFISEKEFSCVQNKLPKKLARVALVIEAMIIVLITWRFDCYTTALAILSRKSDITNFSEWYFAPILYFVAFILTSVTCFLVLNALSGNNTFFEKQGEDTLPMYLSHLVLFMAVGYLVDKSNIVFAIAISLICMVVSIWVFSRPWYRKAFNAFFNLIKRSVFAT